MKRLSIAMVLAVVLMFSGSAVAGGSAVYIGGGISMPSGDFGDNWKMGFGGAGRMGFQVSPSIEVGATIGYTGFPLDDDKLIDSLEAILGPMPEGLTFDGMDVTAIEFLADIKFTFGPKETGATFIPYISGAVGMTSVSISDFTMSYEGDSETLDMSDAGSTDLTFGFGAGFDYMFGPTTGLWVDAKYMIISTEGESTTHMPLRAGIKFLFGGTE